LWSSHKCGRPANGRGVVDGRLSERERKGRGGVAFNSQQQSPLGAEGTTGWQAAARGQSGCWVRDQKGAANSGACWSWMCTTRNNNKSWLRRDRVQRAVQHTRRCLLHSTAGLQGKGERGKGKEGKNGGRWSREAASMQSHGSDTTDGLQQHSNLLNKPSLFCLESCWSSRNDHATCWSSLSRILYLYTAR
jgi:hypothetical protein